MSDTETASPARAVPERRLKLHIDGQDVELFMSFGLLDSSIKLLSDGNGVENAMLDDTHRLPLLSHVLQKRGKYGYEGVFDADASDITVDQTRAIFTFVMDNVTDFFLNAGEAATEVLNKYTPRVTSLTPSEPGSKP